MEVKIESKELKRRYCDGRKGEDFFNINKRLIDLKNVFLTEEPKTETFSLIKEPLDPEGRENINVLEMMKEDGLFTIT